MFRTGADHHVNLPESPEVVQPRLQFDPDVRVNLLNSSPHASNVDKAYSREHPAAADGSHETSSRASFARGNPVSISDTPVPLRLSRLIHNPERTRQ